MREVVHAVGMPADDFRLIYPEHLSDDELFDIKYEVGEIAVKAILNQQLAGRLALEAYQRFGPSTLKHGSHLSPYQLTPRSLRISDRSAYPQLIPQQAYWRDAQGRKYIDGDPAICTTDGYEYPLLRSQLNRNHLPGFDAFVFSSATDTTGASYNFTGNEFLQTIQENEITGWVYMISRKDKSKYQEKYRNPTTRTAWEYRLFKTEHPIAWVRTSPSDLPPDLMVIEGESRHAYEFVRTLPQTTLMDQINRFDDIVTVQPLGGFFPLALHPNVQ